MLFHVLTNVSLLFANPVCIYTYVTKKIMKDFFKKQYIKLIYANNILIRLFSKHERNHILQN